MEGQSSKAVSYIEWLRQSKGRPTFRSMLEADLRTAIEDANDLGHFFMLMEHMSWEISHGNRLGFLALYVHYLYVPGKIEKRQYPPRMTPQLRKEVIRFERCREQFAFLRENGIASQEGMTVFQAHTEDTLASLMKQRTILNVRKKKRRTVYDALADVEALVEARRLYDESLSGMEAEAIVDRVAEEIAKYPAGDVIATRDTHPENYLETQEGRNLPVVHCVKGTPGWELHPKIAAALKDAVIIDKPTFGSRELAEMLAKLAEQDELEITLAGLCTDICVVSNALRLVNNLIQAATPKGNHGSELLTPDEVRIA